MKNYTDINAKTIDLWAEKEWEWAIPISHEEYLKAQKGEWSVLLTPIKPVPKEWFSGLKNKQLLGLASGGGQQMPVFAALGAVCTVMDYSDKQLESEMMVAGREKYDIAIAKADMTKTFPFDDCFFDIIFHPVSNCYVEDVYHVWNECFRVLKKGGLLLAGMDNGLNYLIDEEENKPLMITNKLPYNPLKNEDLYKKSVDNDEGIQFSHSLEEQIGGQLKAGFMLLDLYEDYDNCGRIREYAPSYFATLARKP
jgi:SAM-dependent methyltransferase